MFIDIHLHHLLFIDIETASHKATFDELSPEIQALWSEKITKTAPETTDFGAAYQESAALSAAFGRIVCISIGYFPYLSTGQEPVFRVKSFTHFDERPLLTAFFDTVSVFESRDLQMKFCGHHIQEFDIPYICRRALINGLPLPDSLQLYNKKPWEVPIVDTLRLWRFGEYRNYASLKLLTGILGIPTPKDDIDGSQVGRVFWKEKNLNRIAVYCQKDVVAVAQLMRKFKLEPLLNQENIEIVE